MRNNFLLIVGLMGLAELNLHLQALTQWWERSALSVQIGRAYSKGEENIGEKNPGTSPGF